MAQYHQAELTIPILRLSRKPSQRLPVVNQSAEISREKEPPDSR